MKKTNKTILVRGSTIALICLHLLLFPSCFKFNWKNITKLSISWSITLKKIKLLISVGN